MQPTLALVTLILTAVGVAAPSPQKLTQGAPAVQIAGGAPGTGVDPSVSSHAVHPPDARRYAPLPMPVAADRPAQVNRDPGFQVGYDVATGTVTVGKPAARQALQAAMDFVRGSGGPGNQTEPENFRSLATVSNYASYPFRVNCKIFGTFPDNTSYVASGTLIDPCHVITVGHVIHDKNHGGWARSMFVVPAYNGILPTSNQPGSGREPYGRAYATGFASWSSWTRNRDWNHDIGLVSLDRPVGGITGWLGYGYNTSCSWFTNPSWFAYGYPAEPPHNGALMQGQSGDFDSCPSSQRARFNLRSYGGSSGTGTYRIVGSSRIVYANMSRLVNSKRSTDCCRLDQAKFDSYRTVILRNRPIRFDVTPLHTRAPTKIYRGRRATGISIMLHNYSRVSTGSRTFRFDLYLSTNTTISTADTRLGRWQVTRTIGALGTTTVSITNPLISYNAPLGDRYLGVLMTTTDGNGKRKSTSRYDVHKLKVLQPVPVLNPTFSTLDNVTTGYFYLTGKDLWNTDHVDFGTTSIRSQSPTTWRNGYFLKLSDTALRLYPPQGSAPGKYKIAVQPRGISTHSNTVTVTLRRNSKPSLATPASQSARAATYLYGSVGTGTSTNTVMQLCMSGSTVPTVVPGLFNLEIGDNGRQLYFGSIHKASSTTGATSWAFPSSPAVAAILKGRRVYFQCLQADLNRSNLFPLGATNERSIFYN